MEPVSQQSIDALAVFPTLLEFRSNGSFCDVKVRIGDEIFECHRVILAAISQFFNTMFQSDFKEGKGDNDEPIVLYEVDSVAFKEILNSIPSGRVNLDDSNIHLLLRANDFLQIRTTFIEDQCYLYISQRRNSEPLPHAIDILSFAFLAEKQRFVDFVCNHILEHLCHFAKDPRFMEIPFKVLGMILFKFKERALGNIGGRGNTLLNIIICWVNHSRAERCQYRDQLMKSINSSRISTDYALSLLNKHESLVDKATNRGDNVEWVAEAYDPGSMLGVDIKFTTGTTCVFKVRNFTELWKIKDSPQYRIKDSLWSIQLKRISTPGYLSVFVCLEVGHNSCYTEVAFMILSQEEDKGNFVRHASFTFDQNKRAGIFEFIKWEDIIDKESGYIKDDTVIFQARISF